VSLIDAASHAAINLIVSHFAPPLAIKHLLLPPAGQQGSTGISLTALKALFSCSGPQQLPAQEFYSKYQGLWELVGSEFVSQDAFRQLLVQVEARAAFLWQMIAYFYFSEQVMPSLHLSSAYSKSAVKCYLESKLAHAKATLDEHLNLKFVVGKRYLCEVPDLDSMHDSMEAAPLRTQECVLVQHLDAEYEVQLLGPDESRRLVRVKALRELLVEPVDDCDWSDEAYARDSPLVLAAIAFEFPGFQMSHRSPEPQRRTHWPINFFYPNTRNVRSKMDFDEVDFGILFAPFLSEAMLPSLTGESRERLMNTVRGCCAVPVVFSCHVFSGVGP
jgi:hypothetical protein